MSQLQDKEVTAYYVAVLAVPIGAGFIVLVAALTGVECILRRISDKQSGLKDSRSISREVLARVGCGALLGGILSALGALPVFYVTRLITQDASLQMLRIAAPVSTLVGILLSMLLFLFRKGAFQKIMALSESILERMFILDDEMPLANHRRALIWGILGWLPGSFWPVICTSLLLRYPY